MSPRSFRPSFSFPLLAAAAAIALSGCAGPNGDAAADEGPLSKYLAALWDGEDWNEESFEEEQKKTEELKAACMADEGFDYTPAPASGGMVTLGGEDDLDWNSVEFAEQYGYGIASWPGDDEMQAADEEAWEDPNQDYYMSLSESERAAYDEALYGPQPTEEEWAAMEESGEYQEYDWTTAGCSGKAMHEVQGEDSGAAAYEDPEFAELFAEMNGLYSTVYGDGTAESITDPRAREITSKWAECLASSSRFTYDSPGTARNEVMNEHSQLLGGDSGEAVEPDQAEIEKFKEREIAIAVADAKCREKSGYDDALTKLSLEIEQEFVDEYRPQLEALVAKHGVKKKS